ncbi:MAG: D-alanyl-D-alanine carboxypeptidase [Bacilli bacterium]|nr:D-alanyl-D-alanine carboxypeptidase [Bacilli bacterium]
MKKIKILLLLFIMMFTINVHAVEFDLNSNHAILYNLNDNSVLYEKSSQEKTSIASMTKIMTAIVAIENIDNLDAKVKLTYADFSGLAAANASVAGFRSGEEVTYRDLLYGLMLPSGADAAQSLARNVSGTVDGFVTLMNMKAAELGCSNTHFVNTTGLDHAEHYSTVEDVAKIFQYAIKNKDFLEIVKSKTYTTSNGRLTFKSTIERAKSRYGLSMDYVLGGKTGTTGDAGYCLATIANYNGVDYMLVTAKTIFPSSKPLNYLDAKTIYEYFMNNYSYKNVLSEKDKLVSIKTKYAKNDKVDFYANKELDMYLENTYKKEELIYKYSGIEEIPYDMEKGTKLGKVEVFDKETLLTTVEIVLEEEQEFDLMKYIKANKLQVGGIILVIVLLLAIIIRLIFRKKRKRKVRRSKYEK